MIRTKVVELSTIEAIAYRQKLRGGKSGVVVIRSDTSQPGLAMLNSRTGEPSVPKHIPLDLYPLEAFQEALELTSGLPYTARGKVKLVAEPEAEKEVQETPEEKEAVSSKEYGAVIRAYTNKRGELSYDLLNKDFIQFAKSSKTVGKLVGEGASVEEIRDHIVKAKLETLTGNRRLTAGQIRSIVEVLDAVSPRNVFRELTSELRKMLAKAK